MGWCHEFGVDIDARCDHPMAPDGESCRCDVCGAVCEGRFKGCAPVWARGAVDSEIVRPPRHGRRWQRATIGARVNHTAMRTGSNGSGSNGAAVAAWRHRPASAQPDAPPDERQLVAAIEGMQSELHELESALIRTIDSGDPAELARLDELRALVATTRNRLSWRATDQEPAAPPDPSPEVAASPDRPHD
jgi:hypothetical protein